MREESNDRCGLSRGNISRLTVCSTHPRETQTKTIWQTYEFDLITGSGMRSNELPSMDTKGVGIDRYIRNELTALNMEQSKSPPTLQIQSSWAKSPANTTRSLSELEEHNLHLQSELAAANLRVQQIIECHSSDSNDQFRTPSLEKLGQFIPMSMPSGLYPG